jgi:hypothetical protein
MKQFLRISIVSIVYALFFAIGSQVVVRGNQLSEATGLTLEQVESYAMIFFFVCLLIVGILVGYLANRLLSKSYTSYFPIILWFPYWFFFYDIN